MTKKNADTPPTLLATTTKRKSRKRNLRWQSLIGPFEAGDYQVVPLISSNELREEGELMAHCVGLRYHRWCHVGAVRVFSIRDLDGRRVATASIYYDFDETRWRIEQCKGAGNSEVCEAPVVADEPSADNQLSEIHFVVQELAVLYQRAQEIQNANEQYQQTN